jgi:hypothetical protein
MYQSSTPLALIMGIFSMELTLDWFQVPVLNQIHGELSFGIWSPENINSYYSHSHKGCPGGFFFWIYQAKKAVFAKKTQ